MPRSITIAAAQMLAQTAPVAERLERATSLIIAAVSRDTQLVVLSEVCSVGYFNEKSILRITYEAKMTFTRFVGY